MGAITLLCWLQTAYPNGDIGVFQLSYIMPSPILWYIYVGAQFLYTPLIIWIEKNKLTPRLIWSYCTYFIYSLTWVPITVIGIANKNKKEWFHTQHTRQITIDEVE